MKKYILIGEATGIGGWQLYIDARCAYIKRCGIGVFLIYPKHSDKDVIKLQNITEANKLELYEINYPPYCYTKSQYNRIIKHILAAVEYASGDDVFIESTSMGYSLWGEMIAKETRGQNFSYLLHSHTKGVPYEMQKFFSFKYDQGLLGGQSAITIPELFEGFRSISSDDTRTINASWGSPLCEFREDCKKHIDYIIKNKEEGRKIIAYFGTLNKPNFIQVCDEIRAFTKIHQSISILFISIGSSYNGEAEKYFFGIDRNLDNLELYNIPEIFPIPKVIFEKMDLCIASWGSATAAARACTRTIRLVDDLKAVPQGVIGITLTKRPYHEQPACSDSLQDLMNRILAGDNYSGKVYVNPPDVLDENIGHQKIDSQMRPFMKRTLGYIYYDVLGMNVNNRFEKRVTIMHHIFGIKMTAQLRKKYLMIMNWNKR